MTFTPERVIREYKKIAADFLWDAKRPKIAHSTVILWFNNRIGPGKAGICWQKWQDKGIEKLGDICHELDGRLMSHTEISDKYNVPCTFLDALSIRSNIPIGWRRALTVGWQQDGRDSGLEIKLDSDPSEDLTILGAKRMYSKILSGIHQDSAALRKWKDGVDGLHVGENSEWSDICTRVFCATRETKIQSFQYKLLHRIIPCKVFLKHLRISDTDECTFCQEQKKDTIVHFFFSCEVVQVFWQRLCAWFKTADNLYLDSLTVKEFVFGVPQTYHRSRIVNTILVYLRYYIQRQNLFHGGKLELLLWLREFRQKLWIEEWICATTAKKKAFAIWGPILKELGYGLPQA